MRYDDLIGLAFESVMMTRFRSLLSVLGVTIGVAAVVSGIILGVGSRALVIDKLAEGGADWMWAFPRGEIRKDKLLVEPSLPPPIKVTAEDMEYIKKQGTTIKDVCAYNVRQMIFCYKGERHPMKALVMTPVLAGKDIYRMEVVRGRFLTEQEGASNSRVCVVEQSEQAASIFGDEIPVGDTISVGNDDFKIVGSIKRTGLHLGRPNLTIIILPYPAMREVAGIRDYDLIEISIKELSDVNKARFQFQQVLGRIYGWPLKLDIREYSRLIDSGLDVINLVTSLIIGIAVISLTVGGVGIMNVMMALVVEQTREIGIAKAIGARKNSILLLFLAEATILSLFGGVLGVLIGMGTTKVVTLLLGIPFMAPFWVILLGLFLSLAVGVVSGTYPAKRAAELDPVVTLRRF